MTPEIQKRLAHVSRSLVAIANKVESRSKRTALDNTPLDPKKLAPTTNAIDEKVGIIDKMTTSLLAALNNGNDKVARGLLKTLVKAIDGLKAVSDKGLATYAASKPQRKDRVAKSIRRATTVVARAKRELAL